MIRIITGDTQTDETISVLTKKLHVSSETDVTFCSVDNIPENVTGVTVIVCSESDAVHIKKHYGTSVRILTRPICFSAFAELLVPLRTSTQDNESSAETFSFDRASGTVTKGTVTVKLTEKEGELFAYLLKNHGHAVSRDELRQAIWNNTEGTNAPDVYVSYLRRKLRKLFGDGVLINERGIGYILKNIM